jgi:hypothetical protein
MGLVVQVRGVDARAADTIRGIIPAIGVFRAIK